MRNPVTREMVPTGQRAAVLKAASSVRKAAKTPAQMTKTERDVERRQLWKLDLLET